MKAHTSDFKNNIKQFGRELSSIITYELNGDTIELSNEELNSVTPHYKSALLKSVMKQLDIDSNIYIPEGTIVNFQFGIKVGNSYEYLNYGNYIVYSIEKQEDMSSYKIKCYDKMLYSMKEYETPKPNGTLITYPITINDYINAICTHLGLTFANAGSDFANYNKQIPIERYLDTDGNSIGYTFRDVLDELAQVTASIICINANDELEIRYINNTGDTIDEEYLKDINVNFGEATKPINTIVLSRSADSDKISVSYPEDLPDNEKNAIVIADNQIMNLNDRDTYMADILEKLYGLSYSLNDFSSTGICYYDLCDKYNIQIGENTYSCVMFNDEINITQGLEELIYTELPEETETDYTKTDKTDRKINQTYLIVDKQNQRIDSVITNVTEQDNKISQITQTVDELNSKISDIADITISGESQFATFTLDNINESEPIMIKVRPVAENISYLYPASNLYPSSTTYLKNRIIRFHNNTTDEDIDYIIPDDLLIYSSTVYDEFYLDYDSHTCQITKRCQYNADGTVSALATEQVITYPYPLIQLVDGDYTLSLIGYEYGYLFIRLMAKNIYTSQFATRVEVTSQINQTAQEINLEVSKKTNKSEIISTINQTAEEIKIQASKVNLTGYVTATNLSGTGTTTINGSNITTGNIKSNNYQAETSGTLINLTNGSIDTKGFKINSTGDLTATTGTIAGWEILSDRLKKTAGNYNIEILADTQANGAKFLVWDTANGRYNWYVNGNGKMYARDCEISGYVNATSGSFSGSIYSGSGNIGGWTIQSSKLRGNIGQYGIYGAIRPYGVQLENEYGDILSSAGWGAIINASVSDKRLKNTIKKIDDKYEKLFDDLKPVTFYFNEELQDGKKHIGFIAQDVLESEKNIDENLALVQEDIMSKKYNLYKQEIIALNTWQIQKLKKQVQEQQETINKLIQRIEKIEKESEK